MKKKMFEPLEIRSAVDTLIIIKSSSYFIIKLNNIVLHRKMRYKRNVCELDSQTPIFI